VFVVPLRSSAGQVGSDPTPEPTADAATDGPSAAQTEATDPPESSPPASTGDPDVTAAPVSPDPSASPATTPAEAPTDEAESPSPASTEEPAPDATPSVEVSPGADGAIEIASDVVVVGNLAAYNADGTKFAFTARPADGSAGPDVYVWDTDDARARAVTTDHGSNLAGWQGGDLLVSRVVDGAPWTVVVEPRTGEVREELGAAWLPTVSPDGSTAAWWDGSLKLADDGMTWVPDKGRLVVGPWPDGIGAKDQLQVLDRGQVADWEIQWDPSGRAVAAWTTGPGGGRLGTLGLYSLESGTGRARIGSPLMEGTDAFGEFSLDGRKLVYAAPDEDGDRAVWVVAWDGESVGKVRLPGDATVIR
jgi:hypothetical protein